MSTSVFSAFCPSFSLMFVVSPLVSPCLGSAKGLRSPWISLLEPDSGSTPPGDSDSGNDFRIRCKLTPPATPSKTLVFFGPCLVFFPPSRPFSARKQESPRRVLPKTLFKTPIGAKLRPFRRHLRPFFPKDKNRSKNEICL